jgi:uncharacterized damage-inducible protein DinB
MYSTAFFHDLFAYNHWANRRTADVLARTDVAGKPIEVFAHVIGAERLWFARLHGNGPGLLVWPPLTLEECNQALDELRRDWIAYLDGLTPERMADVIAYTNSQGESHTTSVGDILMHVINHATYHRGQISSAIREAGGEPVLTDFVIYVREGWRKV